MSIMHISVPCGDRCYELLEIVIDTSMPYNCRLGQVQRESASAASACLIDSFCIYRLKENRFALSVADCFDVEMESLLCINVRRTRKSKNCEVILGHLPICGYC